MTLPSNFMSRYLDRAEAVIANHHAWAVKQTDSPIEATFATALLALLALDGLPCFLGKKGLWKADDVPPPDADWALFPQVKIKQYTADFIAVTRWEDAIGRVVVECDGHAFHERTKEQAAHDRSRDREMQALGFKVFRFTGSEIYADAFACARQVVDQVYREVGLG